jgi:catechol 2,3-dioxygenase-like lactoylglutathione lyase family enzyme
MAVPARINLITLGVVDFPRSVAFYEALGWRRSSASTDDTAFFLTGGPILALWGHEHLAADAGLPPGDRAATGGVSLAINLGSDADVDRVLTEAAAAGGTITKPGEKAFWGGYTGNFTDPDGHLWEVAHNPHFPFNPDGTLRLPE